MNLLRWFLYWLMAGWLPGCTAPETTRESLINSHEEWHDQWERTRGANC